MEREIDEEMVTKQNQMINVGMIIENSSPNHIVNGNRKFEEIESFEI